MIDHQFDHQPELVSTQEQTALYAVQYLETLDLYRKEFGLEPPQNIWNIPKFDKKTIDYVKKSKYKDSNSFDGGVGEDFSSDPPLYTNYGDSDLSNEFSGFDGGDGGGGGASGSFGGSDGGSSCSSCSGGCGGGD